MAVVKLPFAKIFLSVVDVQAAELAEVPDINFKLLIAVLLLHTTACCAESVVPLIFTL